MSKITSLFLLFFAGMYLIETTSIPLDPWSEDDLMNSRSLPYFYGLCLLACVLVSVFHEHAAINLNNNFLKLMKILMALGLFLFFITSLGLWVSLALLIAANMYILDYKRPVPLIAISLIFPVLGWLVVERILTVVIPI